MKKNTNWYLAGVLLVGAVIGIIFVGVLTSVVHWAGSEKFCGTFCHSMDVTYAAYKQGMHHRTATGTKAGCSDCHLKYHSNEHVGPIDYALMLVDKAKAGSKSAWGEVRGTMSSEEKQVAMRPILAKEVHDHFLDMKFSTCRGCHDVQKMYNPKKPLVARIHKGMGPDTKVDCLACHPTAGHKYSATQWPTPTAAEAMTKK